MKHVNAASCAQSIMNGIGKTLMQPAEEPYPPTPCRATHVLAAAEAAGQGRLETRTEEPNVTLILNF